MFKNETAASIFAIDADRRTPKYLQIVHSVTKAIKQGRYKKGDRIVSINQLSNECLLSRDTVQKAYDLLERDRIIEAVKGKGFYINRTDIVVPYRVLLIFNRLSHYKKLIYDSFVQTIGNKGKVDLKIHYGNARMLEEIIESNLGLYDYYVVVPHFADDSGDILQIMQTVPPEQLILLDKDIPELCNAAVFQDFEEDIITALELALPVLQRYERMVYVHPSGSLHHPEIIHGFRKFCIRHHFACAVKSSISPEDILRSKTAYIVLDESDLISLIKSCGNHKLKVGKDIGILSYNENAMKEILLGGISVISTNHAKMGETAAKLILENRKEKVHNPFAFIRRNSL